MTTDLLSTATVTGLLVAGLGAVYAYTQHAHAHARADTTPQGTSEAMRKGKKKRKGKAEGEGEGAPVAVPFPRGVPGDFGGVGTEADVDAGANVGSQAAFLGVVSSKQGNDTKPKPKPKPKTKTKKKQQKKQGKGKDGDEEVGEEEMGKSEVGVDDSDMGRARARGPRSGESTDASASLSPSVSAPALTSSSRAAGKGKGNLRASTRLAPPSQVQPREIRSSLSLDTDSSWTHVDRRGLKTASGSIDGQSRGPTDATSSDVASTASESPVVERTDGVPTDMRGARADLVQRTLAEKLVPRPRKTGVDEYVLSFRSTLRVDADGGLACWSSLMSLPWRASCASSRGRTRRPSQASHGMIMETSSKRACSLTMPIKKTKANGASSRVDIVSVILSFLTPWHTQKKLNK